MARCSAAPIPVVTVSRSGSEMRAFALASMIVVLSCSVVAAADWSTIVPGTSTMDSVRGRFGGPSRTQTQTVDGYETTSWVYDGAQAPTGIGRMTVDFGLLQAGGFQRTLVRSFRLEPHPGVFTRQAVLAGWGRPTGVRKDGDVESFFYAEGLLVTFDKEDRSAVSMLFTLPQPTAPEQSPR